MGVLPRTAVVVLVVAVLVVLPAMACWYLIAGRLTRPNLPVNDERHAANEGGDAGDVDRLTHPIQRRWPINQTRPADPNGRQHDRAAG
jgi:hypothetical protein